MFDGETTLFCFVFVFYFIKNKGKEFPSFVSKVDCTELVEFIVFLTSSDSQTEIGWLLIYP
jgi:hypothetical protein